ncbi:uncharacterized protein PgNI_06974 [Pyricularia grisea]|uniref:Uncharacterized protein n=1 Tax=Pyricularia grisea TaxID=148305 RepID=A0A6P8B1E6_PYRGI|nr:uncharacterized protein PgNI_06974 [Pyricularia grisea]TLD08656.1 hypothetical protein PgNI_06974 [Pyricularia grisea]
MRTSGRPIQLSITSTRDSSPYMHQHICSRYIPGLAGQQKRRVSLENKAISTHPYIYMDDETAFMGIFWKFARVGERLSPYISICCFVMAVRLALPFSIYGMLPGASSIFEVIGN